MDDKKRIKVVVDGISFYVSGNEDERYMSNIASYVDKAVKEYTKGNPHISKLEGLILLSLSLKDEVEKQKLKYREFYESVKDEQGVIKLQQIEDAKEEIKNLKDLISEKDKALEKLKATEEVFNRKIEAEILKEKELEEKLKNQLSSYADKNNEINILKNKLKIQESLNFDRNKEIINLKNYIRALKEELNKFEK